MFFIGIFSSPLPYLAIFFIYLVGLINYSLHAKDKKEELCVHDNSIQLDEDQKRSLESTLDSEKTYFHTHFYYGDQGIDQVFLSNLALTYIPKYHIQTHTLRDSHHSSRTVYDDLYIRPPPHLL